MKGIYGRMVSVLGIVKVETHHRRGTKFKMQCLCYFLEEKNAIDSLGQEPD